MNSTFIIILLSATTAFAGTLYNNLGVAVNTKEIPVSVIQNISLIGQIGAKVYYEYNTTDKVNWLGARGICETNNLTFGNTESREEFNYLYEQRKGNDYWVSGSLNGFAKDVYETNKAFEWTDGTEIPNGINFIQSPSLWLCLYFSGDHHTYVDTCIEGRHKVLCQLKF